MCESCQQMNGEKNKFTNKPVKLSVCHRDQNPANHAKYNVAVWCQYCHSTYDRDYKKSHGM